MNKNILLEKEKEKENQIIEILLEYINSGEIDFWKINSIRNEKNNIYIESDFSIESVLKSKREDFEITIYKKDESNIYETSFSIRYSSRKNEINDKIKENILIMKNSKSGIYELPRLKDDICNDKHIDYDIFYSKDFKKKFDEGTLSDFFSEKVEDLKRLINESNKNSNIIVKNNYIEIFNSLTQNHLISSNGINKSYTKNSSYFEFALTSFDKSGKEKEFIVYEKINNIFSFDFVDFFQNIIDYTKDSLLSVHPSDFNGRVLLSDKALFDFFCPDLTVNSLIAFANAKLKYLKISNYEVGSKIVNSKYDKLNISFNPLLNGNSASVPFDSDGISGKKLSLVKDSVLENFYGDKKYSDYLGIKAKGPVGVIEVGVGGKSKEELFSDENLVEIVSFSSFVPDMISGDFSAEIRFGYIYENSKKIPFSGGLFTGNIFKILEEVEFSKEIMECPKYLGPKYAKFHKGEIVGR